MSGNMALLPDVQYKTNYLTEVIARVDFVNPIDSLNELLPTALKKTVLKRFPIEEPQKVLSRQFQVSAKTFSSADQEGITWNFHGRDRKKRLTIVPGAVFVTYTEYESYEALEQDFLDVLRSFFDEYEDVQPSRLGLRYINNISLKKGEPTNWDDYINGDLLQLFRFSTNTQALARVFQVLEFNYDDYNLRYQCGMPNPDYPAPIRQKLFVLDLDAYYQGLQDQNDIGANLRKYHDKVQSLFENSITESLRSIMNGEQE